MEIILDAARWGSALPDLPQYDVRIFLTLAAMIDYNPTVTFVNEELIAKSGVCKSLVQRGLWEMNKIGMLKVVERIGGSYNRTTVELSPEWATFKRGKRG